MNNIIENAISDSWNQYDSETPPFLVCADNALEYGWKEGYEWILTELSIRGYISDEIVKHYMNALCVS